MLPVPAAPRTTRSPCPTGSSSHRTDLAAGPLDSPPVTDSRGGSGDGAASELEQLRAENARLRTRVQRLRKRSGEDSELGYLFVMTYGRSGSTLVSGLLNAVPGYLVRGENRNALLHLFRYHQSLATEKAKGPATGVPHPDAPVVRDRRRAARPVPGRHPAPGPADPAAARSTTPGSSASRRSGGTTRTWRSTSRGCARSSPARGSWSTPAPTPTSSGARGGPRATRSTTPTSSPRPSAGSWPSPPTSARRRTACTTTTTSPTRRVLRGLYEWLGEPWDEAAVRATMAVRHSV